jgi:hypothetical protein
MENAKPYKSYSHHMNNPKWSTDFQSCVLKITNMTRAEPFAKATHLSYLIDFGAYSLACGHSLVYLLSQQFCKHVCKINDRCILLSGIFLPSFVEMTEKMGAAQRQGLVSSRNRSKSDFCS